MVRREVARGRCKRMPDYSSQPTPEGGTSARAKPENSDAWFAMHLSLVFGLLMLAGKTTAMF